ncbi:MAG: tryptophan 7-halogenase [Steroidobacteraceae bacterium]
MSADRHEDIVILGGGLAGLTLSLQLRQQLPQAGITVLEKRRHPVPAAAHKVGESSVEIAANYFDTVLGLEEHMRLGQLKKFGFRFFFSEGRDDIDGVTELGASRYLPTTSYQIDRGIFENFLAERAAGLGVRFLDGCTVRDVAMGAGDTPHRVSYTQDGAGQGGVGARWLVDASGRAGLLKRKFGLAETNAHDCNAAWFRIAARLDVDAWSDNEAWRNQCEPRSRWLSTNHMVGAGYWVWLIPLSSGSHSVGIVAAEAYHPFEAINSFERSMAWLHKFQPRVAREVESRRDLLQDFIAFRHFSYGCRQVYSGDRWALTGEAGLFLDPFYSPGGDFIAISNTYVTDLVARELAGEPCGPRARIYQQYYKTFYESMLTIYTDQYGIFGNPRVLPVKVLWDYTYYWGVLCQIFYQRKLTDLAALTALRPELTGAMAQNAAMQPFLRHWSQRSKRDNPPVMLDQWSLGWFRELNRGLRDRLDDAAFPERVRSTTAQLSALAREIVDTACAECPGLDAGAVTAVLPESAAPRGGSMLFTAT